MTAYFLLNTTQLKWADILCRMSLRSTYIKCNIKFVTHTNKFSRLTIIKIAHFKN